MGPVRLGVAAPNVMATAAATALAEAGGTAVDAAIAATLVAMVTEPGVVSLGGGAFVTVGPPGADAVTIDGNVEMPGRSASADRFGQGVRTITTTYGGGLTTTVGHGSVATPGALAALDLAHRKYGRAPWALVVEPSVQAARSGSPLGSAAASYLALVHELIFGADPASHAAVHHPDGRPLVAGDLVQVADLAETLAAIAAQGAEAFYRGDLARAMVDDMASNGGLVGADDLAAYEPIVRPTLSVDLDGWHLSTNPPPAIGGAVLGAMLLLLTDRPVGRWTPDERARVAVIMAAVLGERTRRLDTADDRVAAAELLIAEVRQAGPGWLRTSPSTAHVSAVDGDGLSCAITTSAGYGSGVMTPGTGVWLNNCLGEPELNRPGLHLWPPGTRLPSNMAPTVGRHADGSALAIGSPGADRITSALMQVLAGLAGGQPLQDAVDAPRVHARLDAEGRLALDAEEDAMDGLVDALARTGVSFPVRPMGAGSMYFGGVGVVLQDRSGFLRAAGDTRREGAVAVV